MEVCYLKLNSNNTKTGWLIVAEICGNILSNRPYSLSHNLIGILGLILMSLQDFNIKPGRKGIVNNRD